MPSLKPLVINSGHQQVLPAGDTLLTNASTTGGASLNLPQGAAPTSPNNGDMWTTTAGLFVEIAGSTVGPLGTGGGGSPGGTSGQVQYNNSGAFGGFTFSGDLTVVPSTGVATLASTAVTPGSYTNANITVDAKGRVTAAANGSGGSGSPGGTSGQIQYNSSGSFGGFTMSGDATTNTSTGALTLATVNSNVGTFGDSTHVAQVTVNAKGLVTAAANVVIPTAAVVLDSTQTVSGVSSVTFSISAGFDYEIVASGFTTASGTNNVLVQAGTGAGPTWDTGNNYFWVHYGSQTDTGNAVSSMNIVTNLTSGRSDNFSFKSKGLNGPNALPLFSGEFTFTLHGTISLYVASTTVTGLRIILSGGGNFSGTFYLYKITH